MAPISIDISNCIAALLFDSVAVRRSWDVFQSPLSLLSMVGGDWGSRILFLIRFSFLPQ